MFGSTAAYLCTLLRSESKRKFHDVGHTTSQSGLDLDNKVHAEDYFSAKGVSSSFTAAHKIYKEGVKSFSF